MSSKATAAAEYQHEPDTASKAQIIQRVSFQPSKMGQFSGAVDTNASADCVGVISDATEFALWLSPHVLENTVRVLCERADWSKEDAEAYARILMRLTTATPAPTPISADRGLSGAH